MIYRTELIKLGEQIVVKLVEKLASLDNRTLLTFLLRKSSASRKL